jgi:hypothetical protein
MMSFLDGLQRKAHPEYRQRMERRDKYIELRQASFLRYMAGEISQKAHEARVAELRKEYLDDQELEHGQTEGIS